MATVPTVLRVCTTCKTAKPSSEFYLKRDRQGERLFSWCKSCHHERTKAHRAANPGLNAKYAREAYQRDPEKARTAKRRNRQARIEHYRAKERESHGRRREWKKAYRLANAERIKQRNAEYRKRTVAERKAYNAAYYEKNREAVNARIKVCQAANPELYTKLHKAAKHRRKVRLVNQGPHEKFADLEIFERDNWICQLCGEPVDRDLPYPDPKSKSLDHIVPIAKGGGHTRANCQLAHVGCNSSKRDGDRCRPWKHKQLVS